MGILNNVVAILMVVLGLGFVIFIHELGHFLVAKWNGVKVEKFAIGFDVANLRLYSRKVGETTYVLGALPLGGYVKMLGEDQAPGADGTDGSADPRAFNNKPVGARMAILSAGVIMNLLLGLVCFTYTYMRGRREIPPVIGAVAAGQPAYVAGLQAGDRILKINGRSVVSYTTLQQAVLLNSKGEPLRLTIEREGEAEPIEVSVTPVRRAGSMNQTIGISQESDLEIWKNWPFLPPAGFPGDPAALQEALAGGGTVVSVGPVGGPAHEVATHHQFATILNELREQPVEIELRRPNPDQKTGGAEFGLTKVVLPPIPCVDLGLRLTAGPVAAITTGSPAEQAGLRVGDRIVSVNGQADFDPMRLASIALDGLSQGTPLALGVARGTGGAAEQLDLTVTPVLAAAWSDPILDDEPLSIPPLGLALEISPTIAGVVPGSPAEQAGIEAGLTIASVELSRPVPPKQQSGESEPDGSAPLIYYLDGRASSKTVASGSWPALFYQLQLFPHAPVTIRMERPNRDFKLTPEPVPGWYFAERGLRFLALSRPLPPQSVPSALQMAWRETLENINGVYLMIRGLYQGSLGKDSVGGTIGIANIAYEVAKVGFDQFVWFLGVISINLAVVNLFPIPPLDGGQLLFLLCEKVRGRPVPERYVTPVMLAGIAFILLLFLLVNINDVLRLLK